MNGEEDMLKRLEELEKMADEVNQDNTELSSGVDLAPIIEPVVEETPPPVPVTPVPEAKPEPASPAEQPAVEEKRPTFGTALNPQVLEILEHTSGALDLVIFGIQAKIARAGLNENTEQLGVLSMVLAHVKNAKIKTDSLLG